MNNESDNDDVEVDFEHPWIIAGMSMYPAPVPTGMRCEPIKIPGPDGAQQNGALLTVMTPAGVTTVFVSPQSLAGHLQQIMAIFEMWEAEAGNGIIVPTQEQARQVIHMDEVLKRGKN